MFMLVGLYVCSPRIHLASSMSFGMMVTRLAWMAHRLASSNSLTRYASTTSWRHSIAADWNRRSVLKILGDLPHQPLKRQLSDEQRCGLLEVADVLQSRSPCPVPVGFHLSPLHPCLVYLPLLLIRPVQYSVAQHGSFFSAGDVQHRQLSVDRRVHYSFLAWLLTGHLQFRRRLFPLGLLTFAGVVLVIISISAPLLPLGSASAATTCTGTSATACTARGLLDRFCPICQLWTFIVGRVLVSVDFGHWDLLPVLFLEVGDKLPHLVSAPTLLCERFLQSPRQTMVNEEGGKRFGCGDMGWARWQGEMDLLLHPFWRFNSLRRSWGTLLLSLV